jgi:hypothetical protein
MPSDNFEELDEVAETPEEMRQAAEAARQAAEAARQAAEAALILSEMAIECGGVRLAELGDLPPLDPETKAKYLARARARDARRSK